MNHSLFCKQTFILHWSEVVMSYWWRREWTCHRQVQGWSIYWIFKRIRWIMFIRYMYNFFKMNCSKIHQDFWIWLLSIILEWPSAAHPDLTKGECEFFRVRKSKLSKEAFFPNKFEICMVYDNWWKIPEIYVWWLRELNRFSNKRN